METVDELIGNSFDYAVKSYFKSDPSSSTTFNINNNLNEFQGGVSFRKNILRDSMVSQYTWTFLNHKTTIWVCKTDSLNNEIIDANRCKNRVQF